VTNRRTVVILVALLFGVGAAIGTVMFAHDAQRRANDKLVGVAVYVVAKPIARGMTGAAAIDGGFIKESSLPRSFLPVTAVSDIAQIKGQAAASNLATGQIVVENAFTQPEAVPTNSTGVEIPAGQVAITITLDPSRAAAGLILPGDEIDLLEIFQASSASGSASSTVSSYAHFFYQNADVIAIGTTVAPAAGSPQPAGAADAAGSSLYTLAVPPEAAERILLAASEGTIDAALVPSGNKATPIPSVNGAAIDGPQPVVVAQPPTLTPYGK